MSQADALLEVLIVAIAGSLAAAVLAAAAAMTLRLRHLFHEHRERQLKSVWIPRLLSLVVDDNAIRCDAEVGVFSREIRVLSQTRQRALLELIVRFAFVVRGTARTRLCRLAEPALPAARALLGRRDPAMRALGVHIVGRLGLDRNEKSVLRALDDDAPLVRKTAARALARAGRTDYVEPILETAANLEDWDTSEVVSVLQDIGPAAQPILRRAFSDPERRPAARAICAEALRWLNDLTAAEPATEILLRENDRELLAASLRLLRRVGGAEHAPAVRRLCTSHDPVIRLNAVATLAATSGLPESPDADLIGVALADPSSWVAIRAARGLREIGCSTHLRRVLTVGHPRASLVRDVWPELGTSTTREAA